MSENRMFFKIININLIESRHEGLETFDGRYLLVRSPENKIAIGIKIAIMTMLVC